jgi:hypothetical protein
VGGRAVPTTPVPTTEPPASQPLAFNFTDSSQYPCSDESTIHSVAGGAAASFDFVNDSSQPLQILWLDDNGNRETQLTLQPNYHWPSTGPVDVGTVWMVASDASACLGIFSVEGNGG